MPRAAAALLLLAAAPRAAAATAAGGEDGRKGGKVCDAAAYGADPSSKDNAAALQAAVAACLQGGEVVVPTGIFLTGPLVVEGGADFTLTLQRGAVLRALTYPDAWPKGGGGDYVEFLQFTDCARCTLQGDGVVDGQGTAWYRAYDKGAFEKDDTRPNFVVVRGGSDFRLLHVTLLNAPKFNVDLKGVAGAEVGWINITTVWYDGGKEPHNTDGIDPGGNSHDVWIHDCYIHNGDDSVAVKPGDSAGGCTRNILVENCHFEKGHGCSIGSVGHGCIHSVLFRNITMVDQQNGCRVKTYSDEDGRTGWVRNITWEHITMKDSGHCITVNANYHPAPAGATNFVNVSDLHLSDVSGSGCSVPAEFICPAGAPCTGIELSNVHVSGKKDDMSCSNAFGTAVDTSPASCLASGVPTPAPPAPPTPPGCDAGACIDRCVAKYGGKVSDQGNAYFCAKGCAGMSSGKETDPGKFCKYAPADREGKCNESCAGASSDKDRVADCQYGCGYWAQYLLPLRALKL